MCTLTHTCKNLNMQTHSDIARTYLYYTYDNNYIFFCTHTLSGGITTLAIDRDALDEYSRATDSDANLDEFMTRMTRDDVIPYEVRERCTVEVTHVRNSTQVSN